MLTENYIHTLNDLLMEQGEQLLAAQKMVASVYYLKRTGDLLSSLNQKPSVNNLTLTIRYPLYIRFLDLRKGKRTKKGQQRKKSYYEPIYNKYVSGYMYGALYNRLRYALSGQVSRYIVKSLKSSI